MQCDGRLPLLAILTLLTLMGGFHLFYKTGVLLPIVHT